jgi:hypothetical protein
MADYRKPNGGFISLHEYIFTGKEQYVGCSAGIAILVFSGAQYCSTLRLVSFINIAFKQVSILKRAFKLMQLNA